MSRLPPLLLFCLLLWGCAAERGPVDVQGTDPDVLIEHSLFPDAGLERGVRLVLDLPRGQLSDEELLELVELDASALGIDDLTGIERLAALRVLMLAGNRIADLSPLSSLIHLETLDLSANRLVDLSPLAVLQNLRILVLAGNALADLSPLAGLKGLTMLDLDGNRIADLSPLAPLQDLRLLNLDNNQVRDISLLTGFPQLRSVELSGNPLDSLEPIEALRARGVAVTYFVPPLGNAPDEPSRNEHIPALREQGVLVIGVP